MTVIVRIVEIRDVAVLVIATRSLNGEFGFGAHGDGW